MPASIGPFIFGDLINADTALRDRATYLHTGAFAWATSGTTNAAGLLLGWAPGGTTADLSADVLGRSATYQLDGGASHTVYGHQVVPIMRYFASSFTISAGVAWYLTYPTSRPLLSRAAILGALPRYHKDGTLTTATATGSSFAGTGAGGETIASAHTVLSVPSGSGILVALSAVGRWDINAGTLALGFDVHTDGVHRFRVMSLPVSTANNEAYGPTLGLGFGLLRYSTSLTVTGLYAAAGSGFATLSHAAQYVPDA